MAMGDHVKVTMDQVGLRSLERDLRKEMQTFFDQFTRRNKGKPVAQVKQALRREWQRDLGGSITEPELTEYARLISEGVKIKMR